MEYKPDLSLKYQNTAIHFRYGSKIDITLIETSDPLAMYDFTIEETNLKDYIRRMVEIIDEWIHQDKPHRNGDKIESDRLNFEAFLDGNEQLRALIGKQSNESSSNKDYPYYITKEKHIISKSILQKAMNRYLYEKALRKYIDDRHVGGPLMTEGRTVFLVERNTLIDSEHVISMNDTDRDTFISNFDKSMERIGIKSVLLGQYKDKFFFMSRDLTILNKNISPSYSDSASSSYHEAMRKR